MGDTFRKRGQEPNDEVLQKQAKNSGANGDTDNEIFSPKVLLMKLFEGDTGDWEMIGSDGVAIKFHQAILSEQVPHFRTLFSHTETMEWENKQIVIPEELNISGVDVKAFLRFVYYQDVKQLVASFRTTCALIRLAHYYNIVKLVESATKIIQAYFNQGKLDWFSVPELYSLFQQILLWEDAHPHKANLMDTIVDIIKKMFQNNEEAALDRLLPVTNGDAVLRDLIVKLVQDPRQPKEIPLPTEPPVLPKPPPRLQELQATALRQQQTTQPWAFPWTDPGYINLFIRKN